MGRKRAKLYVCTSRCRYTGAARYTQMICIQCSMEQMQCHAFESFVMIYFQSTISIFVLTSFLLFFLTLTHSRARARALSLSHTLSPIHLRQCIQRHATWPCSNTPPPLLFQGLRVFPTGALTCTTYLNLLALTPAWPASPGYAEHDPALDPLYRGGCGAAAAVVANTTTYPLDIVRARVALQGCSAADAFKQVVAGDGGAAPGYRNLFKGTNEPLSRRYFVSSLSLSLSLRP